MLELVEVFPASTAGLRSGDHEFTISAPGRLVFPASTAGLRSGMGLRAMEIAGIRRVFPASTAGLRSGPLPLVEQPTRAGLPGLDGRAP